MPRFSYHRIDPDLVLPTVRAQIERDCTAIAEGKQTFADVVQRSLAMFRAKFSNFVASIALMDELFESSFTQMQSSQSRALSRCGRCRRYMQFVSIKPQRMYCPTCEDAWSLPQGVIVKGGDASARCPLCEYELIMCQTQSRVPKSYMLCPHCYNNPPFEELKGHAMTCGSFARFCMLLQSLLPLDSYLVSREMPG
jgi:DNA topoisomerase-3